MIRLRAADPCDVSFPWAVKATSLPRTVPSVPVVSDLVPAVLHFRYAQNNPSNLRLCGAAIIRSRLSTGTEHTAVIETSI